MDEINYSLEKPSKIFGAFIKSIYLLSNWDKVMTFSCTCVNQKYKKNWFLSNTLNIYISFWNIVIHSPLLGRSIIHFGCQFWTINYRTANVDHYCLVSWLSLKWCCLCFSQAFAEILCATTGHASCWTSINPGLWISRKFESRRHRLNFPGEAFLEGNTTRMHKFRVR